MTAASLRSVGYVCCPGPQEDNAHLREHEVRNDSDIRSTRVVQLHNAVSLYSTSKDFNKICTNYPKS